MSKKKCLSFNKFCRIAFNGTLKSEYSVLEKQTGSAFLESEVDYIKGGQQFFKNFKTQNRRKLEFNFKEFVKRVDEVNEASDTDD